MILWQVSSYNLYLMNKILLLQDPLVADLSVHRGKIVILLSKWYELP